RDQPVKHRPRCPYTSPTPALAQAANDAHWTRMVAPVVRACNHAKMSRPYCTGSLASRRAFSRPALGAMGRPMSAPVIRPARPEDAAALAVLGRQTFIDTFVTGCGIPYPAADLTAFLDASFNTETLTAKL